MNSKGKSLFIHKLFDIHSLNSYPHFSTKSLFINVEFERDAVPNIPSCYVKEIEIVLVKVNL